MNKSRGKIWKNGEISMNCKKCKKEIPEESIYCMWCGAKQVAEKKTKRRANGTRTVFKTPDGNWKAQKVLYYYNDKDGNRKKKTQTRKFNRKTDALKFVGTEKEEFCNSQTLTDLYEIFKETKKYEKLSKSQQDKLKFTWDKMKEIQFTKISDLTIDKMQEVIDKAAKTYYPARDMKVLLSHLYTVAIKRQQETINKSEYIELPDAPKAKRQVFTEEDIAKLWDDYNGQRPDGTTDAHELTGYVLIMVYTGMRIGELFGIEKVNVHLSESYMIGGEKTDAGRDREIPISSIIESVVKHFYDKGKTKLIHKNKWDFYDDYWDTLKRLDIRPVPPQTCRHTYFYYACTKQRTSGFNRRYGRSRSIRNCDRQLQ